MREAARLPSVGFEHVWVGDPVEAAKLRERRGTESIASHVVFHGPPAAAEELVQQPLHTFHDPRFNALEPDYGSVVNVGSLLPSTFGAL